MVFIHMTFVLLYLGWQGFVMTYTLNSKYEYAVKPA
jgi:hypothetical protein